MPATWTAAVVSDPLVHLLTLLVVIALGYLLGKVKLFGMTLGASGVVFIALAAGHFGYEVPESIGLLGLVLFVYCLGIGAGPAFLTTFSRQGKTFVVVGAAIVLSAMASTWVFHELTDTPTDLAAGIYAGSMTSTPALAAASEVLPDGRTAVGFGIAYPVGVIGVVLFVQLLPRLLGRDFHQLEAEAASNGNRRPAIVRMLVDVKNPAVVSKRISRLPAIEKSSCQVTRVLVDSQLRPIPADFTLQLNQTLLLIGPASDVQLVCDILGTRNETLDYVMDVEQQRGKVVVSEKQLVGKSLRELRLLSRFGITVARITRHDYEFVPRSSDELQFGDALTVVGEASSIADFSTHAGNQEKAFDETSILSLTLGILAGVLLGSYAKIHVGPMSLSLGMAGGTLVVGLVLGHFGRIGPLVGHLPRASRMLLTDIGLAFFLADAGVKAGAQLEPILREHGPMLIAGAAAITLLPMLIGLLLGSLLMRMSLLEVLGTVCGGMTSTPGLGAINSKTDSDVPIASYAAVYPVALLLVTALARIFVRWLG